MGELHLEIIVDRMRREFKVEANVGAPQVAYRETITGRRDRLHPQEADRRRRPVRPRQDALRAAAAGSGFEFENAVVGGTVPKEYVPGVEKGLKLDRYRRARRLPGDRLQGELFDGAYHDVDSNVLTFEIASRAGFKEGIMKAGPKLLEPIMRVEVVTPEEYMGDVIGDLNSRRGQVTGMDSAAMPASSTRWCRSLTCSATSTTCA